VVNHIGVSVRDYRARRDKAAAKAVARARLAAVAVDGKTARRLAALMGPGCICSA